VTKEGAELHHLNVHATGGAEPLVREHGDGSDEGEIFI